MSRPCDRRDRPCDRLCDMLNHCFSKHVTHVTGSLAHVYTYTAAARPRAHASRVYARHPLSSFDSTMRGPGSKPAPRGSIWLLSVTDPLMLSDRGDFQRLSRASIRAAAPFFPTTIFRLTKQAIVRRKRFI